MMPIRFTYAEKTSFDGRPINGGSGPLGRLDWRIWAMCLYRSAWLVQQGGTKPHEYSPEKVTATSRCITCCVDASEDKQTCIYGGLRKE
jgi:hypothetical protein